MGIKVVTKWEKSTKCVPVNNIISSDFPKYTPQPWKFMEGEPVMSLVMSYEYQRLWLAERDAWQKRMYPDTAIGIDRVKLYVLNFKAEHPPKDLKKSSKKKKSDNAKSKKEKGTKKGGKEKEKTKEQGGKDKPK